MDDLHALDALFAEDRLRGDAKAEDDSSRLALGLSGCELAKDVHVALHDVRSRSELRDARSVELELGRVDNDVCAGEVAHLVELRRRPRGLNGAAPSENHDLSNARAGDGCDGLVGGVGRRKLVVREREHSCDVERDVAVADHDHALGRAKVEVEVLVVGVAVVPGDELRGRPRSSELLAGNSEPPVGGRAVRIDDRVVQPRKVVVREIPPDVDVSEEAKAGLGGDLLVSARHGLEVRVIGSDAEPHQAPRRGQALDHVNLHGTSAASSAPAA